MLSLDPTCMLNKLHYSTRRHLTSKLLGHSLGNFDANRLLKPRQNNTYRHLLCTRTAAQLSSQQSEDSSPSLPPLSSPTSQFEDPLHAATASLDPERTTAALGYTWLTHWQLIEEDRRFRQLVFQSTRGRQLQRHQQLLDYLEASGSSDSDSDDSPEVRIVHGRLSIVPSHSTKTSNNGDQTAAAASAAVKSSTNNNYTFNSEETLDDLTWLASHPEAEDPAILLDFDTPSSSGSRLQIDSNSQPSVAVALPGAVQLRLGSGVATVRPLWISVYLEESTGLAKLFESVAPLDPEIVDKVTADLAPFCSVSGLNFGALADLRHGPWLNYFVGLVGDVAVDEADILWPNQILHRDRVLYNVRDAGDVARFLADPRKEDIEAHEENLKRLADERGYKKGWCWYMLRSRWGEAVLKELKIDPRKMMT